MTVGPGVHDVNGERGAHDDTAAAAAGAGAGTVDGDLPPVRVAVVGLGWAGRSIWLPRLRAHPGFAVVAAVDPSAQVRAEVAAEFTVAEPGVAEATGPDVTVAEPGVRLFASADELRAEDVDLAVVAVPNNRHSMVAAGLLAAGIPVFLEKPVCLSSAEADSLATAERVGGVTLLAGSAARYRADVLALYRLAADLGEIRHIELAWVRARGIPDAGGWFTTRQLSGGGALVDLGWHLLDVVVPLLGTVEFDQVVGTTSDDFVSRGAWGAAWRHDEPAGGSDGQPAAGPVAGSAAVPAVEPRAVPGDVEDTARGFLVTRDGVSVSLRASWASHEAQDATTIRIEGSAGVATLRCTFGFSPNRAGGAVLTHTRAGTTEPVPVADEPIGTEYRRQLDALPAQLRDLANPGRAVDEARPTIAAIERFYQSARRHRTTVTTVATDTTGTTVDTGL